MVPNETMDKAFLANKIKVFGIVQGVGFRPFVYRLAIAFKLTGEVSNCVSGVDIFVEGKEEDLGKFIESISENPPPMARIDKIVVSKDFPTGIDSFSIVKSSSNSNGVALISPDISVCKDCLKEIDSLEDLRYCYPFTNCTNCGPRYTIIDGLPYDRGKTSMSGFVMCSFCKTEYEDPENRRFHAQPNACPECGPELCLVDTRGEKIISRNSIKEASNLIKLGFVLAIKGVGGFHLVVDATNNTAVTKLRKRKCRPDKPFALMSRNLDKIRLYATVSDEEEILLRGVQRPIVLLEKKKNSLIAESVSPRNKHFGVMLPYTPLHYLLFDEKFLALVMTSGNLSGEPICTGNEEAIERLGKIADYFLMNNRDILTKVDDSVLKEHNGKVVMLRRSRGYVPEPIKFDRFLPSVLAFGAEDKNTVCFTKGDNAFVSQYIGDLKNKLTYDFFKKTVTRLGRIFSVSPDVFACDYHQDYVSTKYAFENVGADDVVMVQHHHAHIASCMAENRVIGPVIGVALDGTGMGLDGTVWGGEVLLAEYSSFKRIGCLEAVPMPGSSAAIREPWRMAVSYLYKTFGESFLNFKMPFLKTLALNDIEVLVAMIREKINSPYTSSLGRFFDGIAAMLGIRNEISFEGQAAIELEFLALRNSGRRYEFHFSEHEEKLVLLVSSVVEGVVSDIGRGTDIAEISEKFHNTIISMFAFACITSRKRYGVNRVALSGGGFQNDLLLYGLRSILEENNFEVLVHSHVPFNDGGISLGQAFVALHSGKNN